MTRASPKTARPTKRAHARRAIGRQAAKDAPNGANVQQERTRANRHPLIKLSGRLTVLSAELATLDADLADLAPTYGDHLLTAAKVLEGVRLSLGNPQRYGKALRLAAARLGRLEMPHSTKELKPAASALRDATFRALQETNATPEDIATAIDFARTASARLGTTRLLPHEGTEEERIALFAKVIKRVQARADYDGILDPWTVLRACARACGNRREIFGAQRKREQREDLK